MAATSSSMVSGNLNQYMLPRSTSSKPLLGDALEGLALCEKVWRLVGCYQPKLIIALPSISNLSHPQMQSLALFGLGK
jgi:hypothetical protein